ncbi:MAG: tRNA epoxyqueuosine(34) reductase QueG [Tepidanaerobacteraceae bacterium]|jgi:epoxyqueuosine reductase|nr:tRNA epoxyqueuosine(34) reductase QueG [Tepidanaerobacteraceae bacterium]
MGLKEDVKKFAKGIGLDAVGFASVEPFLQEKEILLEKKARGLLSSLEEQDVEFRCHPERLFPGARTIICFAIGYLINPYKCEETVLANEGDGSGLKQFHGKISRYAMVKDYHCVMMVKLKAIVKFISEKKHGRFKIFVDTGSLMDKAAARRSGIGWIGENTCLFTPELGSWVFLGEILTDIEFEPDKPAPDLCDHCGKCVQACPTGALTAPYQMNPHRCLSYITQKRGPILEEFRKLLGSRIFGCDTCQEACPKNKSVRIPHHPEFVPDFPLITDLTELAIIDKTGFERIFKPTAAGWRGRNVLRRNAICALGNVWTNYERGNSPKNINAYLAGKKADDFRRICEKDVLALLDKLAADPSEIIREQAGWTMQEIFPA